MNDRNTLKTLRTKLENKTLSFKELQGLIRQLSNINAGEATALHHTCMYGNIDMVKEVIKRKADVNARDGHDITPLHVASERGSVEIVIFLLKKGADVKATDASGLTVLHYENSWRYNATRMVEILCKAGADVNATDEYEDSTPLHYACKKTSHERVQILIKKGANVNLKNKHGETPLHFACLEHQSFMVRAMLDAGADVSAADNLAAYIEKDDIKEMIQNVGKNEINNRDRYAPHQNLEWSRSIGEKISDAEGPLSKIKSAGVGFFKAPLYLGIDVVMDTKFAIRGFKR